EKLAGSSPGSKGGKSGARSPSPRPAKGDSDVRLVMDSNLDFQIDLDSDVRLEDSGPKQGGSSSKSGRKSKLGPGDSSVKMVAERPSDSDVKVVSEHPEAASRPRPPKGGKSPSDSDIRLEEAGSSGSRKRPAESQTEEVIDLDAEQAKLAEKPSASGKRPRVTQAANPP